MSFFWATDDVGSGDVKSMRHGETFMKMRSSYFHRHELAFESILMFEDQVEVPGKDLAELSDIGGDMISSLESHQDFSRRLLSRIVA